MQKKSAEITYTLNNLEVMPLHIIRQGKEIWSAYQYVEQMNNRIRECKEYEEKMFKQCKRQSDPIYRRAGIPPVFASLFQRRRNHEIRPNIQEQIQA